MLNFMFLTAFTGWPAAVTCVLVVVTILFSPFFWSEIQEYWSNFSQRAEEQKEIINTIVRTNWDPEVFKAHDECAICAEPFRESDKVTPLPCNPKHYFHSECTVKWFSTGQGSDTSTCPLCKTKFTREQLQEYSDRLNTKLADKADKE